MTELFHQKWPPFVMAFLSFQKLYFVVLSGPKVLKQQFQNDKAWHTHLHKEDYKLQLKFLDSAKLVALFKLIQLQI